MAGRMRIGYGSAVARTIAAAYAAYGASGQAAALTYAAASGGAVDWNAKYTAALAAARGAGATLYVDPANTTGSASNSNAGTSRAAP